MNNWHRAVPQPADLMIAMIILMLCSLVYWSPVLAEPVRDATRARLRAGQSVTVIVEFDATTVDTSANNERSRRRLTHDDAAIRTLRRQGYAQLKSNAETAARGNDATPMRDFANLPMAVWRISSLDALNRLQSLPGVRSVHEDVAMRPNSVSDLAFINQPAVAAQGAQGTGTVIVVIDGGLGSNYLNYSDFGTCTAVNTPASTCRVAFNQDDYPGASSATAHGTNVSAIALGVAPGARLAMYNVFNGSSALTSDIISAMNDVVSRFDSSSFNVAAVNLSLGDGSSHSTQCGSSNSRNSAYSAFNIPVAALRNLGILTVVAAGNSGSKSGLSDPACVPNVVSVGAVYDGSYGAVSWGSPASCTDTTAADKVTCFSQSASYLTVLAPGSFVSAPSSSFQMSGTSQAAPHIAGSIAVLRARYPLEPLSQTIQRLTDAGVQDADANAGNRISARLNLLGAVNEGTLLTLSGEGPTTAIAGNSGSYVLTVTNSGPLVATTVTVANTLPDGATFISASSGCTYASRKVLCVATSLAAGATISFTINVQWTTSGSVYDIATLQADQNNTATSAQQLVAIGTPPASSELADAPMPAWATVLLSAVLMFMLTSAWRHPATNRIT